MAMKLTKEQYQQINSTLLGAFPTKESLTRMLRFQLDKHLNSIVSDGNLQNMIFELVQTAEAEGWIEDLITGAREANPHNSNLLEVSEKIKPNLLSFLKITNDFCSRNKYIRPCNYFVPCS